MTAGFERDEILASGGDAKRFKRFINRSLIYPPADGSTKALLELGRSAPAGPLTAALQRLALRSRRVRQGVTGRSLDQADRFAVL